MLLVLILFFGRALADSDEDKYVDLLPDAEKQQFIEQVARRILKDVESQENATDVKSIEMSEEMLKKHSDYVKAILKEETENIKRSKDKDSDEADNLDVKALEDLTLRSDRRDIAPSDGKKILKVEIVTDDVPIIKRSVENEVNKTLESDETTAEVLKRVSKSATEESEKIKPENEIQIPVEIRMDNFTYETTLVTTKEPVAESTTENTDNNDSQGEDLLAVKPLKKAINDDVPNVKTRKSNNEPSAAGDNDDIEAAEDRSGSAESNDEEISVRGIDNVWRKSNDDDKLAETPTNDTITSVPERLDNKTDLSNNTNTNDESTAPQNLIEDTTVTNIATTITNKAGKIIPLVAHEDNFNITTEIPILSTVSDEVTTNKKLNEETSPGNEATTIISTTKNDSDNTTTSVDKIHIIVEEFISTPNAGTNFTSTTARPFEIAPKIYPKSNNKIDYSKHLNAEKVYKADVISVDKKKKHKVVLHRLEKYVLGPKSPKSHNKYNTKNFIDLGKVYYNNNFQAKSPKKYYVYEIPAGESPFTKDEDTMAEQPYYIPVYNYAPKNAYFNPQNRLGPNTEDTKVKPIELIALQEEELETVKIDDADKVTLEIESEINRKKFGNKEPHNIHKQPLQHNQKQTKLVNLNPQDYLDSDYFFGRLRRDNEDSEGFPNSDEKDHPTHSMLEGNLKDHVRAVRNILFHHKSFGLLDSDKYGKDIKKLRSEIKKRKDLKFKNVQAMRAPKDFEINKSANKNSARTRELENNIAIDYYFGKETPYIAAELDRVMNSDDHMLRIGYLNEQNDTKDLYVMDGTFKDKIMKYLESQDKSSTSEISPATPLPKTTRSVKTEDENEAEVGKKNRIDELITLSKTNEAYTIGGEHRFAEVNAESNIDIGELDNNLGKLEINASDKTINQLNLKLNNRRNDAVKLGIYLKVLKDLITLDTYALKHYDWLGTTVDIQSALQKLFELIDLVSNRERIHPADLEILKYVVFLHKLAGEIIEANDFGAQLRKKLILPRNKKKSKPTMLKEKGLINRVWLYLRRETPEINDEEALKNLNNFLMKIEDGLYELHESVKHIAKITKYKKQFWYQNLKDLYITTEEKQLIELLLHMTSLRLFGLIEESAKNGLEDDYVQYMKNNKNEAKKTLEDMIFVMQVLDEYNKFVE